MKWVIAIVVAAAVGGGVWFHVKHKKEAEQIEDKAEMRVIRAKMDLLNTWINACKNHSAPTKLDGAYDGFSYDKEGDYVAQEKEQEQRYKDLQARLTQVDKVN